MKLLLKELQNTAIVFLLQMHNKDLPLEGGY